MRRGATLQPVDAPSEFESMVDKIESWGYDDLWLTDSSMHAQYVYVYLALAARRTTRLRLGTAVTNPLTRHPALTANAFASLDLLAPGRTVLGIGAGDRPLLALGKKPARLATLEASIDSIRRLWAGSSVTTDDRTFSLDNAHLHHDVSRGIPVYVSASGPRTLELAGRVADGVILLAGLHPEGIQWALDHIDRGVDQAGRDARPTVTVFAYGAVDEDEDRAFASARTIAAWFPQTAPMYCELAGLSTDIIEAVQKVYSGGEFQEAGRAADLLPDDFVHRMALAGNAERARQHLRNLKELGVDDITVFPLGDDRLGTLERFAACMDEVDPRDTP